jgi:integral membrane protein
MIQFNNNINRLSAVGLLEGLSCIGLFLIAMPLKYKYGYEGATAEIGMIHGVLFIAYNVLIVPAMRTYKWPLFKAFLISVSAIIPFGTFITEAIFLKKFK